MNKIQQYDSAVRLSRKATLDKLEEFLSEKGLTIESRGSNLIVLKGETDGTCEVHVNPKESRFSVNYASSVGKIDIPEKKMQILVDGKQASWFLVDVEDINEENDGLKFVPSSKQLTAIAKKVGKTLGG